MKQRFEYRLVDMSREQMKANPMINKEDVINKYAREGWRAVNIIDPHGMSTSVLMERPIKRRWWGS